MWERAFVPRLLARKLRSISRRKGRSHIKSNCCDARACVYLRRGKTKQTGRPDLARQIRSAPSRFTRRSETRDISKSGETKLPHPIRDGRFHFPLSGDRPDGFCADHDRVRSRQTLRREQVAEVLSRLVSKRTRVQ